MSPKTITHSINQDLFTELTKRVRFTSVTSFRSDATEFLFGRLRCGSQWNNAQKNRAILPSKIWTQQIYHRCFQFVGSRRNEMRKKKGSGCSVVGIQPHLSGSSPFLAFVASLKHFMPEINYWLEWRKWEVKYALSPAPLHLLNKLAVLTCCCFLLFFDVGRGHESSTFLLSCNWLCSRG